MKIPPQAKLVFEGIIFDVYQWEQEMFDGSIEIFEAVRRMDTVQVIPVMGDKIIIGKEDQPFKGEFYTLLGGRQEKDEEDTFLTAKRELAEESGLVCEDWSHLFTHESPGKVDWKIQYFIARDCKKAQDPHLDPGEKIEIIALSFNEFLEYVFHPQFRCSEFQTYLASLMQAPEALQAFKDQLFS